MTAKTQKLFLAIDGGQSHTAAVIADEYGTILGRGLGGPSNHAEQPGGRDRLRAAVAESTAAALSQLPDQGREGRVTDDELKAIEFAGVHRDKIAGFAL